MTFGAVVVNKGAPLLHKVFETSSRVFSEPSGDEFLKLVVILEGEVVSLDQCISIGLELVLVQFFLVVSLLQQIFIYRSQSIRYLVSKQQCSFLNT